MVNPFGSYVRLAVLEEKLDVYEELSREMLAKLESAVDKISEANQNVAKILVRHEEKLEKTIETDTQFLRIIDELRNNNEKKIENNERNIKDLEKKLQEFDKWRWVLLGGLFVVGLFAGHVDLVETIFPQPPSISKPVKVNTSYKTLVSV